MKVTISPALVLLKVHHTEIGFTILMRACVG